MISYPFVLLEDVRGIQANVIAIDNIRAMEILIRNIESTTLLPVERIVLDTEFAVRESSRVLNRN